MLLFCLPYAGGSEAIYYKWKDYLEPAIELCPIELKGRGRRFNEDNYRNFKEAVNDILYIIRSKILDNDYAIYGHSMGSLLAYELYYKVDEEGLKKPKHIFFSGYKAPNTVIKDEIYKLQDSEFMNEVIKMGGMTDEIVQNKELMKIFIPILKSDFRIINDYNYVQRNNKIRCDVSILNGKEDSFNLEEILEWKNHCDKNLKIYNLEGNHFFINDNVENITKIINNTLGI